MQVHGKICVKMECKKTEAIFVSVSRVGVEVRLLLESVHRPREERSACHENVERAQTSALSLPPCRVVCLFSYGSI
jgi:hypothetical protein